MPDAWVSDMEKATELREGLQQLREILVGAIQRDLDHRITRAEGHSAARVGELSQELRKRIDVVEAHARKDADAQRELVSSLEERVRKLEDGLSRAQHDLRQEIVQQTKSFLDELHGVRSELVDTIDRELASFDELPEEPSRRELRENEPSPAP